MLILNTISNNYKNLISCLLVTFGLLVSTSSQASASLLNQEVCASSDTLFIQSTNGENDKCNIVNDNNIPEFTVPGPQGILVNISSENVWLTRSVSGPFTDFDFDITLSELSWGDKKGKITGVSSSGDDNNFDTVFTNTSITINYDAGDEPGLADDLEVHFDLEVEHIMPDEEHSVVNPDRDLSEFKVNPSVPDITPSLESQLSNELKTLINNDRGTNFIFFDQVSNEIQILASLVNFPLLADSPFLVSNDFTNLHLVYRDAMGSNSGMDLGLLNQGGETFFTLDASMFNPEFNTWQLTYAACNPNTNQCMEGGDDEKVLEPSSTIGLLALGILGGGATLKRKLKSANSTEKETTKIS